MAESVYREQLDKLRCGNEDPEHECDHDELYLHSRCHPRSPVWAVYGDGKLQLQCAECDQTIVAVAVASDHFPSRLLPRGRRL